MRSLLAASLFTWSLCAGDPSAPRDAVIRGIHEFRLTAVGEIQSRQAEAENSALSAKDELDKQLEAAFGRKAQWEKKPVTHQAVYSGFPGPTPVYRATLEGKVRVLVKEPLRTYRVALPARQYPLETTPREWDAIYIEQKNAVQAQRKDFEDLLGKKLTFFHAIQTMEEARDGKHGAYHATVEVFYQE